MSIFFRKLFVVISHILLSLPEKSGQFKLHFRPEQQFNPGDQSSPEQTEPKTIVNVNSSILDDIDLISTTLHGKPFGDGLSREQAYAVFDRITIGGTAGRITENGRVVVDSEFDGQDAFKGACEQSVRQRFLRPPDERLTVNIVGYHPVAVKGLARFLRRGNQNPAFEKQIVETYRF